MSEQYIGTKFKTLFQGGFSPKKEELELIEELIIIGQELGKMGFKDDNGGNFSVRSNNNIIIKTTGALPHRLKKDDFVLVSGFNGEEVYVLGNKEPSSEARLHWEIYQARPEINCVLHSHDFLAISYPEEINGPAYVKDLPYGSLDLAQAVKEAVTKSDYLILKNHGVLSIGQNISTALKLIKEYHERFKTITKSLTADS